MPRPDLPDATRTWADTLEMLIESCHCPTQAKLAEKLNVSAAALSRYRNVQRIPDRRFVENLLMLAQAYDKAINTREVFEARSAAEQCRNNGQPADQNEMPAQGTGRSRRRIILIGVGTALAAVVGGGLLMWHAAGADCSGRSCHGQNHHDQGCDDEPQVLSTSPRLSDGSFGVIMYSPECEAAWGRLVSAREGASMELADQDGNTQHARLKTHVDQPVPRPTPMLATPPGTQLQACVTASGETRCTKELRTGS